MPLTFGRRFLWQWGDEGERMFTFSGCVQRSWVETYWSFPFGFSTSVLFTKSVGFWTGSMISKSTIRFNSFSNFGFKARDIFLTGVTTGVTLSLISIWWVFFRVPISPKQSENSDKNCSALTLMAEISFIRSGC